MIQDRTVKLPAKKQHQQQVSEELIALRKRKLELECELLELQIKKLKREEGN